MSKFDKLLEGTWNKYGEDPAKMLVHTGTAGWILSALAQITAVFFNDKISAKEKTFLIPQQLFDAAVNIGAFFLMTCQIKRLSEKLVTTGKIVPQNIRKYLLSSPFKDSVGKTSFNIEHDAINLLSFKEHKKQYAAFKNIFTTASTIGASIFSCNILTPILRNNLASHSHNTIVKNVNEGKHTILTKDDLDNKNPKDLHMRFHPINYGIPQGGLKV